MAMVDEERSVTFCVLFLPPFFFLLLFCFTFGPLAVCVSLPVCCVVLYSAWRAWRGGIWAGMGRTWGGLRGVWVGLQKGVGLLVGLGGFEESGCG